MPGHQLRRTRRTRSRAPIPSCPKQLQRIARFALEQPHDLALGTVAAVAEAAEVQPSAMIRFANALGYGGFSEMQQVFRGHLVRALGQLPRAHRRSCAAAAGGRRGARPACCTSSSATRSPSSASSRTRPRRPTCDAAVKLHLPAPRACTCWRSAAPFRSPAISPMRSASSSCDPPARRRGRHAARTACAASRRDDVLLVAELPQLLARGGRRGAGGARARRAGDRHHRQRAVAAQAARPRVCFELGDASDRPFRSLVAPLCLAQALVVSAGHRLAESAAQPHGRSARRRNGAGVVSASTAARCHLRRPRRGRPVRRADRRPAGGHAVVRQVPRRLAGQHRGRRVAPGPASAAMLTRVGDEHNGRFVRETLARRRRRRVAGAHRPQAPHRAGLPRHPRPRHLSAGLLPRPLRRHGRSCADDVDAGLHRVVAARC